MTYLTRDQPSIHTQSGHTQSGRIIGGGTTPYIIAEIGTNHNRSLETARLIIKNAAACKCDCVKFQIYEPNEIVSSTVHVRDYGLDDIYGNISARDMFEQSLKTPKEWFPELSDYARTLGLDCAATIHGQHGIEWAKSIGFDLIKVASMDHTNRPFLEALVKCIEAPIMISFGMAELNDIDAAVGILEQHSYGFGLFHCISLYPPRPEELRLVNIPFLRERFKCAVGFSDHTTDVVTSVAALTLGACCFEKHVTFDRTSSGPDHSFALEFEELGNYVENLRTISSGMQGEPFLAPLSREIDKRALYLKSVTLKRALAAGHVIQTDDIYMVRPGSGIAPCHAGNVVGRRVKRTLAADATLVWEDIDMN